MHSSAQALQFSGTGADFARIWYVNLALTLVTLGLYGAWGKVRTRRYLYGHTQLDGEGLEYHANPWALFKGYLITTLAFIAFSVANKFFPLLALVILGVAACVAPWILWQSLRFNAHNTGYLGLRFAFRGSLADSYRTHLAGGLLTLITLGLAYPFWQQRRRRFAWGAMSYGNLPFEFDAPVSGFYKAALVSGLTAFLGYILVVAAVLLGTVTGFAHFDPELPLEEQSLEALLLLFGAVLPLGLLTVAGVQAVWTARTHNLVFDGMTIGENVVLKARLAVPALTLRFALNNVLLLITLGLAYPWTRIATWKLLVESVRVRGSAELAQAAAVAESSGTVLGDAASSVFDLDLGL